MILFISRWIEFDRLKLMVKKSGTIVIIRPNAPWWSPKQVSANHHPFEKNISVKREIGWIIVVDVAHFLPNHSKQYNVAHTIRIYTTNGDTTKTYLKFCENSYHIANNVNVGFSFRISGTLGIFLPKVFAGQWNCVLSREVSFIEIHQV